jgi:hypothetical protein
MIAVVGIGAVALSRSSVRATTASRDWSAAGVAAQSGIEYAIAVMNSSSTWRTDLTSGAVYGPLAIGAAKVGITLVDEADGDLSNDASQSVRVYAVATVGGATRTYSVLTAPTSPVGYDVLRCAVASAGSITVSDAAVVTFGPLSANTNLSNSAQITSDVETGTLDSTGFILGYVQTGLVAKNFPGVTGWNALAASATTISYAATGNTIDKEVLTPGLNTISSTTNAGGVYAISVPASSTLRIRHSRLQATLLITLGVGSQLIVQDENLWDPGAPSQPALLVQGGASSSVTLGSSTNALSESAQDRNFNRAGAPYNGVTDGDTTDTYPNELHGLYHIISAIPVTISNNLSVIGCVVAGGNVTISTAANLAATPALLSNPPTGYSDPSSSDIRIVPGAYQWVVANANPAVP